MKVGQISALTWNRLGANSAQTGDLPPLNAQIGLRPGILPEGVTCRGMTQEEAALWLSENAPQEPRESVVAGKTPVYHPQAFGTGLGAEYDDYVAASGAAVQLLEAAPGTKSQEPILWEIEHPDESCAVQSQILHIGEGADVTVIFWDRSTRFAKGLAGLSTKIVLEPGAHLLLARAQTLGEGFVFFDDIGAALRGNAQLTVVQVELGAQKTYIGTQSELVGDRARFDARVGWFGTQDRLLDINYNAVQRGRKSVSAMKFDGVLTDRSRKTFRGTIDFRRGAAGSSGNESEDVLLLSDDIVNKTLPIILCEEEDMEGSHGATIGRLDEGVLFYLASRGIDEKEAEQMMVRARLGAVIREIPDEQLQKRLAAEVEEAFLE